MGFNSGFKGLILQFALLLTQNRETYLCKGKGLFHNAVKVKNID